jgi:hypothetical protein
MPVALNSNINLNILNRGARSARPPQAAELNHFGEIKRPKEQWLGRPKPTPAIESFNSSKARY